MLPFALLFLLLAVPSGPMSGTPADVRSAEVPILLVPGWSDTERELAALRIRLVAAGWAQDAVETLSFESAIGGNRAHAAEIAEAVDSLVARTGAEKIDIVAHSMGGLATRWYLLPGDRPVRRVVFIATPHRGTYSAYLAFGEGREEMSPGSDFLQSLNASPAVPIGMEAITIRTPIDTHIIPGENATLTGFPDHVVCCPTHGGLLRNADVFRIVRRFLEEGS